MFDVEVDDRDVAVVEVVMIVVAVRARDVKQIVQFWSYGFIYAFMSSICGSRRDLWRRRVFWAAAASICNSGGFLS
jgi:hypothetical protein